MLFSENCIDCVVVISSNWKAACDPWRGGKSGKLETSLEKNKKADADKKFPSAFSSYHNSSQVEIFPLPSYCIIGHNDIN